MEYQNEKQNNKITLVEQRDKVPTSKFDADSLTGTRVSSLPTWLLCRLKPTLRGENAGGDIGPRKLHECIVTNIKSSCRKLLVSYLLFMSMICPTPLQKFVKSIRPSLLGSKTCKTECKACNILRLVSNSNF